MKELKQIWSRVQVLVSARHEEEEGPFSEARLAEPGCEGLGVVDGAGAGFVASGLSPSNPAKPGARGTFLSATL